MQKCDVKTIKVYHQSDDKLLFVEHSGLEPLTLTLPVLRSTR